MKRVLVFSLSLLVLLLLPRLGHTQKPGDAKAGKDVFMAHCAACHGPDGNGKDAVAKLLGVTFPKMSSATVQGLTDEQITQVVKTGKDKMKPVPGLSASDLANVVAYVRTFKAATP